MVMQVDGWIRINPEGEVADFTSDTKLLPKLRENLDRIVHTWRFEPVLIEGTPRMVRARTRIVLAANRVGDVYQVKVDNVTFPSNSDATAGTEEVAPWPMTGHRITPPSWPKAMRSMNVSGQVLLCILVGADGHPEKVLAVQSMLFDVKGETRVLRKAIAQFERSAMSAAQRWHLNIPAARSHMPPEHRTVRVPVEFIMGTHAGSELPGQWRLIVRNSTRPVDWVPASPDTPNVGVSDVAAGEIMSSSSLVKLNSVVIGTIVM
ncbi:MAG: hypothetical protein WC829_22465 [Hyphomicrobium sp.]